MVKWYDPEKAFGFVTLDGEGDLFVHRSVLPPDREYLVAGETVKVEPVRGRKGQEVGSIVILQPELPSPRPLPSRAPVPRPGPGEASLHSQPAKICSIDQQGRFAFARLEGPEAGDVYIHRNLMQEAGVRPRVGDRLELSVESTPRGLRATSVRVLG